MKKIMFNDKYGLTEAVLNGKKTQTRRVIKCSDELRTMHFSHVNLKGEAVMVDSIGATILLPSYAVGEVVAVAQCYMSIAVEIGREDLSKNIDRLQLWQKYVDMQKSSAYTNKMFVKAELMPHHIRITDVRVEKLQDISDEDCLAEGIHEALKAPNDSKVYGFVGGNNFNFNTPREAYAALIDKVSGKGTWESNPYVFVYDFELVD